MTAKTQGKPTDIIYRTNPEISKTHFPLKRNKNAPIMVLPPQYQLHTDEKGTDRQDLEDRVHKQIVFWYAHSQSDSVETRLPLKRTQLNTHCGDILFSEKKDWRLEQSAMLAIRQFMNVYSDHIFSKLPTHQVIKQKKHLLFLDPNGKPYCATGNVVFFGANVPHAAMIIARINGKHHGLFEIKTGQSALHVALPLNLITPITYYHTIQEAIHNVMMTQWPCRYKDRQTTGWVHRLINALQKKCPIYEYKTIIDQLRNYLFVALNNTMDKKKYQPNTSAPLHYRLLPFFKKRLTTHSADALPASPNNPHSH